ncbi:MAG: ATP-binding protein [Candidatus Njordarchaeales archaeon]
MKHAIGIILSGATTTTATCQILEEAEGKIHEGMLVLVKTALSQGEKSILARIAKIETYNEFFEVGDVWSEARRKNRPIPVNVARRYVICRLDLLGVLPRLDDVPYPPTPGDYVYLLEKPDQIFAALKRDEVYISFGSLYGYLNAPVPLRIESLPMHIAILGVTGSGKSYTVGYLIEKLSKVDVNGRQIAFPMVIIDANGDYLDYYFAFKHGEFLPRFSNILRLVFPKSLAGMTDENSIPIAIDLNILDPRDLAEAILEYYGSVSRSELQASLLETLFEKLRKEGYRDFNAIFYDDSQFESIILGTIESIEAHRQTKEAAKRALRVFRNDLLKAGIIPFSESAAKLNYNFVDELTENGLMVIIDFSTDGATGISLKMKQFVVAYLTKLLYNRFVEYKIGAVATKNGYIGTRYALLIIEEAQNYCPNLDTYPVGSSIARENLALIATQGRKFGLGLVLVTQRPSFVDPIVFSMMNSYFIHRIAPDDINYVRRALGGLPESILRKLPNLETGTLVISGQILPVPFPLLVRVPRREIEPTIGSTDLSSYLRKNSR